MLDKDIISKFDPITLQDMDSVRLLDRVDTKFVTDRNMLPEILAAVAPYYYSLEIAEKRQFAYNSLYFDTMENSLYLAHHNGRTNRFKVRQREYVGSNLFFLEVKSKSKLNRTIKYRMQINNIELQLSPGSLEYIRRHTPYKEYDFKPIISTRFNRITLVSKSLSERITIDTDIFFQHNGSSHKLENLVIIEQKRDVRAAVSHLSNMLEVLRIFPQGFSKYCMGRAFLEQDLKSNNFKPKILTINKINNGKYHNRNARQS